MLELIVESKKSPTRIDIMRQMYNAGSADIAELNERVSTTLARPVNIFCLTSAEWDALLTELNGLQHSGGG